MKKIISFFVAVLLVASMLTVGAFADETDVVTKVYGTTATAQPGETVTISFMISNNTGFDSTKMSVSAAAPLTVGEITRGLMSGGDVFNNIINHASGAPVTADGTLFSVSIKVAEDAQPGTYPVSLSVTRLNVNGESLTYKASGGAVVIPEVACEHDWQLTERVESSCTEAGYEIYTCSKCGETKRVDLKLAGHDYIINIKNDEYHTYDCKNCDKTFDENHDHIRYPGQFEDDDHWWCETCGWEKAKPENPTSPDPEEPVLGDIDSNVESQFNFGLVALIAVACGAAFAFKRKFVK
ncbi:MAG: hypothetical protein J6B95_00635 [Oscillospiraceae bacterium]|nr:hypothetical protein [Oscillospiraceae bacterium]